MKYVRLLAWTIVAGICLGAAAGAAFLAWTGGQIDAI